LCRKRASPEAQNVANLRGLHDELPSGRSDGESITGLQARVQPKRKSRSKTFGLTNQEHVNMLIVLTFYSPICEEQQSAICPIAGSDRSTAMRINSYLIDSLFNRDDIIDIRRIKVPCG
jgi:hypothetical protein